jgi:hypothetical protein
MLAIKLEFVVQCFLRIFEWMGIEKIFEIIFIPSIQRSTLPDFEKIR